MRPEEFLRPAAKLVQGSVVFEDLADGTAVAHPVEEASPEPASAFTDSPEADGAFTDDGVIVAFFVGATARGNADGKKAGAVHSEVEFADAGIE